MYDAQVFVRKGEKGPDYGTISVPAPSTLSISSVTFQLLNADHSVFTGGTDFSSPVVAQKDSGSGVSKNIWYVLSDTDTALMVVGSWYIGQFVVTPSVSDSVSRITVIEVQICCTW